MNTYQDLFPFWVALAPGKEIMLLYSVSSEKYRESRLVSDEETHRPTLHLALKLLRLNHQINFPGRVERLAVEVLVLHHLFFAQFCGSDSHVAKLVIKCLRYPVYLRPSV